MSTAAMRTRQDGQALVELLVALLSMVALYLAVGWLGRAQDATLQAGHEARYLVFSGVHGQHGQTAWHNTRHNTQTVMLTRLAPIPPAAQPAGHHPHAPALRRDWAVADSGLLQAVVRVQPPALPVFERRAFALADAGHAHGDGDVRQRLATADLPWAQTAAASQALAQQVAERMGPVDQAWGRVAPDGEWLSRWQEQVPPWHLQIQGQAKPPIQGKRP